MTLVLRPARPDDLATLRHWDRQPHVIAAGVEDWGWDSELSRHEPWREFLIAELAGRPLGFLQIIDPALEDSHYWGEVGSGYRAVDIWLGEAADLGKGHGTAMMQLALARCFASPEVQAVLVDPLTRNVRSHRFYERLGFRFLRRQTFGSDDCRVYRLTRADYESQPAAMPKAGFLRYTGGCHCGAVRFAVQVPEAVEVEDCNCSICAKAGFLHLIVPRSRFELLAGADRLTTYTFNTGVAKHTFCSRCGMKPFYTPRSNPDGVDVNLRCLDAPPPDVRVVRFDGRDWESHAAALAGKSRD